ncbi:hypothetical protein EVAR_75651_1 [Eumeta japonica]|uniref:Uncharacterized protein n=1 Tax=Eumeta variegata TaxID=151549 RepID=A0A4C1U061_EUMVA|nr:hypothetical protein EVAR_75651_1 [Eumeta japonica]
MKIDFKHLVLPSWVPNTSLRAITLTALLTWESARAPWAAGGLLTIAQPRPQRCRRLNVGRRPSVAGDLSSRQLPAARYVPTLVPAVRYLRRRPPEVAALRPRCGRTHVASEPIDV